MSKLKKKKEAQVIEYTSNGERGRNIYECKAFMKAFHFIPKLITILHAQVLFCEQHESIHIIFRFVQRNSP